MSISVVTKLQLDFDLDLVKKFCAIGEFKDLAALMSGSHPGGAVRAEEPVPRREPEPSLENRGAKRSPFPLLPCVPWATREVKEGALFPHGTPGFSLVPVLSQSGSLCPVPEPRREGIRKDEAGRGCSTPEAPRFSPNIVLEVAGDGDSRKGQWRWLPPLPSQQLSEGPD